MEKPLKTQFYVLNENIDGAEKLLDQAEVFIDFFTRNFGQYPWINEKLGIVNTPYWGMEHQTIIAYGNEYKDNETLDDIINIAGGFVTYADTSNIEITRFKNSNDQIILN